MKKSKNFNDLLEIPKEVYSNSPNFTVTSFNEMIIENYKGILEYETNYIRINTYIGIISIRGIDLKLKKMTDENIIIIGQIISIELEQISD